MQEATYADSQSTAGGTQLVHPVAQAGAASGQMQQTGGGHQQQHAAQHHPDRGIGSLDLGAAGRRVALRAVATVACTVCRAAATPTPECRGPHRGQTHGEGHAHQAEAGGEGAVHALAQRSGGREPDTPGHQETGDDRGQAPDVPAMAAHHRTNRSRTPARGSLAR